MISNGPERTPELPLSLLQTAAVMGLHVFHLICDQPNAKVGDFEGVSFKVGRISGEKFVMALPNVYAVRVRKRRGRNA